MIMEDEMTAAAVSLAGPRDKRMQQARASCSRRKTEELFFLSRCVPQPPLYAGRPLCACVQHAKAASRSK